MSEKISPDLIREHGAQLRRITLEDKRAAELAEEVARLNGAVMDAADTRLGFNDDPNRYAAFLAAGARPARGSK